MDKKPQKIAIILPTLVVGGAEKLVFEELSYMQDDPRFSFELHLVHEAGCLFERFADFHIPIRVWNTPHRSPLTVIGYLKIVYYLRKKRFDVIHCHLIEYQSPWIGHLARIKTIFTVHNNTCLGFFKKFCIRHNSLVFGCGRSVVENLKNFMPSKKLKMLQNGIKKNILNNRIEKHDFLANIGIDSERKIIFSVGRLTEKKGYDILIRAIEQVMKKIPNIVLLIAGDGPDREKLCAQILNQSMQDHIYLLGNINNVRQLMRICDVYVNSSRYEGLPMSILEAMVSKRAIIATNIGGNIDVIKNGWSGLLVPYGNVKELRDALVKILIDNKMRKELSVNAFNLFMREYTIEQHCAILAEEYLKLAL